MKNLVAGIFPMFLATLALCLTAATALPAGAENTLKRPNGCERVATAQYDDCEVSNHFKCSGTAPVVYREETIDGDGVLGVETYDKHWGTLEIVESSGELVVSAKSQTVHPREALQSGSRIEVVKAKGTMLGMKVEMNGRAEHVQTGDTKEIAGQTFRRFSTKGVVNFEVPAVDMKATSTFVGSMLFHEGYDLWIVEVARTKIEGEPEERSRLKHLALPGQSGFGATQPKFGCSHLSMLGDISEVPA